MSRKLHKFQTVAEYQAYSASTEYTTPCVAVVEENNVIYYDYGDNKPQVDLSDYKVESQEISVGLDKFGKDAITKINYIPNGIIGLGSAFSNLTSLEEVTCNIPDSVTILNSTFYNCPSLVNAPVIPSGVTDMDYIFYGCSSLVNATEIPSGLTSLKSTFYGCSSLITAPVIPSSVTNMKFTFYGCSSLVNAPVIPSGVTNMLYTFHECRSLVKTPDIPSGVTRMELTFFFCSSLKEVTLLPKTPPTYIQALDSCPKLETIYVPDESLEDYITATGWSEFADKIKPLSSKPSE